MGLDSSNLSVIIQARLNSTRLPGKVMMELDGKPILRHVIEVACQIGQVIVASPDKEIADYAESLGVLSFIGSETNVLDRYYQATFKYGITDIVRLTADNPLVEVRVIRKVMDKYLTGDFDYVSNNLKRTYPVGLDVEVFSFEALSLAWLKAETSYEREHVTPFIRNHPELFKLSNVESETDLSHLRWTVDTLEDLERVRGLFNSAGVL